MHHSSALADPGEPFQDLRSELAALRIENAALQSLLYGLSVALAQMSEVHREVIIQALDLADRNPLAEEVRDGAGSHAQAVAKVRSAIMTRVRSIGI